jgi:hypothetical protein
MSRGFAPELTDESDHAPSDATRLTVTHLRPLRTYGRSVTKRQWQTAIGGFAVLVAAIVVLVSFVWNTPQWSAFGTVMYAAVATIAALFAGRQILELRHQIVELRRSREEQARPFVVVDIRSSPVWANILSPTPRAHAQCANGHPHYAEDEVRYGTDRER